MKGVVLVFKNNEGYPVIWNKNLEKLSTEISKVMKKVIDSI